MLGPHDIGHRVVVRRVVGRRDGRPLMTDVLGVLTALTDSTLTVDTESAGPLTIDRAAVVAAKRVPPRSPRRGVVRRPGGEPGTGSRR